MIPFVQDLGPRSRRRRSRCRRRPRDPLRQVRQRRCRPGATAERTVASTKPPVSGPQSPAYANRGSSLSSFGMGTAAVRLSSHGVLLPSRRTSPLPGPGLMRTRWLVSRMSEQFITFRITFATERWIPGHPRRAHASPSTVRGCRSRVGRPPTTRLATEGRPSLPPRAVAWRHRLSSRRVTRTGSRLHGFAAGLISVPSAFLLSGRCVSCVRTALFGDWDRSPESRQGRGDRRCSLCTGTRIIPPPKHVLTSPPLSLRAVEPSSMIVDGFGISEMTHGARGRQEDRTRPSGRVVRARDAWWATAQRAPPACDGPKVIGAP